MSTFKVGEVAVGQNFEHYPEHNGEDLLVVEGLSHGAMFVGRARRWISGPHYRVQSSSGEEFLVRPHNLRKKRPPTTGEESILALFSENQREGVAA